MTSKQSINLYPCITLDTTQSNTTQSSIYPLIGQQSYYSHNHLIQQNISSLLLSLNNYNIFTITNITNGNTYSFVFSNVSDDNARVLNRYLSEEPYITQNINNTIYSIVRYGTVEYRPELLIVQLADQLNVLYCVEYCIDIDQNDNITIDTKSIHIQQITSVVSPTSQIQCFTANSNTSLVYACDNENVINAWSLNAVRNTKYIEPVWAINVKSESHNNTVMCGITSCCILNDCVVVGGVDNTIKLYDTNTLELIHAYVGVNTSAVTCIVPVISYTTHTGQSIEPICPNTVDEHELLCIGTVEGIVYILSLVNMNIHDILKYNSTIQSPSVTTIGASHNNGIISIGYTNGMIHLYQLNIDGSKSQLIGQHSIDSDVPIIHCEYNSHNDKLNELIVTCYNSDTHLFTADSIQQSIQHTNQSQQQRKQQSVDDTMLLTPSRDLPNLPSPVSEIKYNDQSSLQTPQPLRELPQQYQHNQFDSNQDYHTQSHYNTTIQQPIIPYIHAASPVLKPSSINKSMNNPKRVTAILQQQLHATQSILGTQKNSALQIEQQLHELQQLQFDPAKLAKLKKNNHNRNNNQLQADKSSKILNVPFKQQIYTNLPKIDSINNTPSKRSYVRRSSLIDTNVTVREPQLTDTYRIHEREIQYSQYNMPYNNANHIPSVQPIYVPPIVLQDEWITHSQSNIISPELQNILDHSMQ